MPARVSPLHPAPSPAAQEARWRRWLGSRTAAVVLLAAFWGALVLGWRDKGLTDDEGNHALGGYTYWKFGDYRINPENGNLPQRVAGLALVAADFPPPATDTPEWRASREWAVSQAWVLRGSIDADRLLRTGRAAMALLAVALAALAWAWSRRLFGPLGGAVTLLLCVSSPMLLANGPLITSDTAAALFFLAAVGAYWRLLHRVTPVTVLLAGAATAGLSLSKMSAVLLVPVAVVLLVARTWSAAPLPAGWWRTAEIAGRGRRFVLLVGASLAQAAVAWGLLWAAYGFRYAAFAPGMEAGSRHAMSFEVLLGGAAPGELLDGLKLSEAQSDRAAQLFRELGAPAEDFTAESRAALAAVARDVLEPAQRAHLAQALAAPPAGFAPRLIDFCRTHRLLPEAMLVGTAHARYGALARVSFLDGEIRPTGRPDYFPRTLLYKNPAAVFGVALLAGLAAWAAWRRGGAWRAGTYAVLPLIVFSAIYWAALLPSGINIGHRHALPTYAPCFVLCGAAAAWWSDGPRSRARRGAAWVLGGLLVLAVGESAWRWPNTTSFFSAAFGGPVRGWRHLADSSIDWGQELPAVRRWLDRRGEDGPVFFSYFGNDSPRNRGIRARYLHSFPGLDEDRQPVIGSYEMPRWAKTNFLRDLAKDRPEWSLIAEFESASTYECAVAKRPEHLRLTGGTYLFSAAMLRPFDYRAEGPIGPWCERHEKTYQELRPVAAALLANDSSALQRLLDGRPIAEIAQAYRRYDVYRFHRLTAWLRRNREPEEIINGCVLVFRLSNADIQTALEGPPPELGIDLYEAYRAKVLGKTPAAR